MRIRLLPTVLFVALCLTGGAASGGSKTEPATVRTPPTFFVTGHGWGHGLGMSQYGAYGYAQHGWTYDRIIKHYYTGTTIGQAPIGRVRVLLADKVKQVQIASKSARLADFWDTTMLEYFRSRGLAGGLWSSNGNSRMARAVG